MQEGEDLDLERGALRSESYCESLRGKGREQSAPREIQATKIHDRSRSREPPPFSKSLCLAGTSHRKKGFEKGFEKVFLEKCFWSFWKVLERFQKGFEKVLKSVWKVLERF